MRLCFDFYAYAVKEVDVFKMTESLESWRSMGLIVPSSKEVVHLQNYDVKFGAGVLDSHLLESPDFNPDGRYFLEVRLRSFLGIDFAAYFLVSTQAFGARLWTSDENLASARLLNDILSADNVSGIFGGRINLAYSLDYDSSRIGFALGYALVGGREFLLDRKDF